MLPCLGIEVRHDRSSYLMHHKFLIIDEKVVVTGSFNWTQAAVIGICCFAHFDMGIAFNLFASISFLQVITRMCWPPITLMWFGLI